MPPKKLALKKPAPVAVGCPVLVTTEHRGVFFGYADPAKLHGDIINLTRARLCLYWSRDVRGFMGLAAMGPSKDCRVGPPATIDVRKITAVLQVTPEAVAKWESAPWSS
jgi:hypothetical protein